MNRSLAVAVHDTDRDGYPAIIEAGEIGRNVAEQSAVRGTAIFDVAWLPGDGALNERVKPEMVNVTGVISAGRSTDDSFGPVLPFVIVGVPFVLVKKNRLSGVLKE